MQQKDYDAMVREVLDQKGHCATRDALDFVWLIDSDQVATQKHGKETPSNLAERAMITLNPCVSQPAAETVYHSATLDPSFLKGVLEVIDVLKKIYTQPSNQTPEDKSFTDRKFIQPQRSR